MKTKSLPNNQAVEVRGLDPATGAVTDEPLTIAGYAAVFYDSADPGTEYVLRAAAPRIIERIQPGAFDRTLADPAQEIVATLNHQPSAVLGRRSAGTLRLSTDPRGLRYEVDLDPQTPEHVGLARRIQRGDIRHSSFIFRSAPGMDRWERPTADLRIRHLVDLTIEDVGPATFPAYTGTSAGPARADDLADDGEALASLIAAETAAAEDRARYAARLPTLDQ